MAKQTKFDLTKPFKKHASLVHINNKLTLLQHKTLNILLFNADEWLLTPGRKDIDLDVFCVAVGYNSKNFDYLKESMSGLRKKEIEGDLLNDSWDVTGWRSLSVFSDIELDYQSRTIYYEIPSKLAKVLYDPERYAILNLSHQNTFKSDYELALYENLSRFRNVGSTGWIEVEIWRKMLGATESSYDEFKVFNNRVLKPSCNGVDDRSDIDIQEVLFDRRGGRTISHIKIKFEFEGVKDIPNSKELMKTPRYRLLIAKGMDKPWALYASSQFDDSYIQEKVDYADKQQAAWKIKKTYQDFLNSAIMGDYGDKEKLIQTKVKTKQETAKTNSQQQDVKDEQTKHQTFKNRQENTIRFEVYRESQPEAVIESIDNTAFESDKGRRIAPTGWHQKSENVKKRFLKEYYAEHILKDYEFTAEQEAEIQKRLG